MTRFEETMNADRVRDIVSNHVRSCPSKEAEDIATMRNNIDTAVEYIYQRLPSGDYGRGDVRRVIEATLLKIEQEDY